MAPLRDTSLGEADQLMLRELQSEIEPSDFDEEADEEDPEALAELEKRKEEILEEFLELAIQKRYEAAEEVRAECKRAKAPKDQEKKRLQEVQAAMDALRKAGIQEIKKKLALIVDNESIPLRVKLERLQDTEQIKAFMLAHFALE